MAFNVHAGAYAAVLFRINWACSESSAMSGGAYLSPIIKYPHISDEPPPHLFTARSADLSNFPYNFQFSAQNGKFPIRGPGSFLPFSDSSMFTNNPNSADFPIHIAYFCLKLSGNSCFFVVFYPFTYLPETWVCPLTLG